MDAETKQYLQRIVAVFSRIYTEGNGDEVDQELESLHVDLEAIETEE